MLRVVESSSHRPIYTRHGFYQHVVDDIGCKVFNRRGLARTQVEYLFNLYAQHEQSTKGLTCEVLACGTVLIEGKSRPAIWMKHIDGVTVYNYLVSLGYRHNSHFTPAQAEMWALESRAAQPILKRIDDVLEALKSIGISCEDHDENTTNFMLEKNGRVRAIDYSAEDKTTVAPLVLKRIYSKYYHMLGDTIPDAIVSKLKVAGVEI